jgi:hypothetical protein
VNEEFKQKIAKDAKGPPEAGGKKEVEPTSRRLLPMAGIKPALPGAKPGRRAGHSVSATKRHKETP